MANALYYNDNNIDFEHQLYHPPSQHQPKRRTKRSLSDLVCSGVNKVRKTTSHQRALHHQHHEQKLKSKQRQAWWLSDSIRPETDYVSPQELICNSPHTLNHLATPTANDHYWLEDQSNYWPTTYTLGVQSSAAKRKRRNGSTSTTLPDRLMDVSEPFNFKHRLHVDEELKWNPMGDCTAADTFELVEKLGEGAYGQVYKANASTGHTVVVKILDISEDAEHDLCKEIDILRAIKHPNIVRYYGTASEDTQLWILMEYCAMGSIRDVMETCRHGLKEQEIAVVVLHTLKALSYLHLSGIIHRDVKAANILLTEDAQVKIADFGVSEKMGTPRMGRVLGTPLWMAPEAAVEGALPSPMRGSKFDSRADVWSLGITLIEMAETVPPFSDQNPMFAWRMSPHRPPPKLAEPGKWTLAFNEFIAACLTKDATQRPDTTALFSHPFLLNAVEAGYTSNPRRTFEATLAEFKAKRVCNLDWDKEDIEADFEKPEGLTLSSTCSGNTCSGETGDFSDTIIFKDDSSHASPLFFKNLGLQTAPASPQKSGWGETTVINPECSASLKEGEFKVLLRKPEEEKTKKHKQKRKKKKVPSDSAAPENSKLAEKKEQRVSKRKKKGAKANAQLVALVDSSSPAKPSKPASSGSRLPPRRVSIVKGTAIYQMLSSSQEFYLMQRRGAQAMMQSNTLKRKRDDDTSNSDTNSESLCDSDSLEPEPHQPAPCDCGQQPTSATEAPPTPPSHSSLARGDYDSPLAPAARSDDSNGCHSDLAACAMAPALAGTASTKRKKKRAKKQQQPQLPPTHAPCTVSAESDDKGGAV
eukprot:TRINITY_DN15152_c0_g1_i1.p1 TRINITY_DN15152_c0_g1~~TRINITY_DN15152_c0_g1_i1.p1  ORF type:complete len:813 (-),score=145.95 TRINITY_DN15152_c0_g1_i1:13-2451(-)